MREVFWGRSASRDDVITLFVRESHLFVQLNPGGELTFTVLQAQLTAPPGGPMEKIKRDCGMSTEARVVTFELQGANSEETGNIV